MQRSRFRVGPILGGVIIVFIVVLNSSVDAGSLMTINPYPATTPLHPTEVSLPSSRPVPFTDENGDTIIQEQVIQGAHGDVGYVRSKAPRVPQPSPNPNSSTNLSATTRAHTLYLPSIQTPEAFAPKVFVVAYMDVLTGITDANTLIGSLNTQLITDLGKGSTWHGYNSTAAGSAALRYSVAGGVNQLLYETPPHYADGTFNYQAVYSRFNICSLVQQGKVDEVWVWESGSGHAVAENVVNGPTWSLTWGEPVPNCGKTVTTYNLNYQRQISQAMESFGHSLEYLMSYAPATVTGFETCDWLPRTREGPSITTVLPPPPRCTSSQQPSNQYAFIVRPFPRNSNIATCGDVHRPPNIVDDTDMHDYSNTTVVHSRCMDWQWNGTTVNNVSCAIWNCEPCNPAVDSSCNERNEEKYLIWWMQNIPGLGNNDHGRTSGLRPSWWTFRFR